MFRIVDTVRYQHRGVPHELRSGGDIWYTARLSPMLGAKTIVIVTSVEALSTWGLVRLAKQGVERAIQGSYSSNVFGKRLALPLARWISLPHTFEGYFFSVDVKVVLKSSNNVTSDLCLLSVHDGPKIDWPNYRGKGLYRVLVMN